jgi:hypothetical protein
MNEIIALLVAGAFGAVIKDVVKDNKLILPKCKNGEVILGCIGGILVGMSVGYLVDGSPITAFFGGYAGTQMLQSLIPKAGKE